MIVTSLLIGYMLGQSVAGNSMTRGKTEDSEIVIVTTSRCAGAIHSLTWRGHEFLDSFDHGRQLQSASNLDLGTPITGETYNPTEAGSRDDGLGAKSTSQLLKIRAKGNRLETTSKMAFWLAPGEDSGGNPAKNTTKLSNHLLHKVVTIGVRGRPHLIGYDVTFSLPKDEVHTSAVFEALTGYMPAEFSRFWRFDADSQSLKPLSDGPGEQPQPVILATEDGAYAMGIYSSDPQTKGYGRFRFPVEHVVKWNCVFRVANPKPGSVYHYHHLVAVGTLDQVREEMRLLTRSR